MLGKVLQQRWRDTRSQKSVVASVREIAADLWEFARDSTPPRRRSRYGDVEYDWESHLDTTAATVTNRTRLLAALSGAPYQPTEPTLFSEMLNALALELGEFTFIDLGSGKGRTLFMAAKFGFRHIVGVELLPELHQVAERNIADFKAERSNAEQSNADVMIESVCLDAREYTFPARPIVLYLFNPLPSAALEQVIVGLRNSAKAHPRPIRVIYHNPSAENVLARSGFLKKIYSTHQYAIYSN